MRNRSTRLRLSIVVVALALGAIGACKKDRDDLAATPPPEIISIIPDRGSGVDPVVLETAHFVDDFTMVAPEVLFGLDPVLSVTALTSDTVAVTIPLRTPGAVDVWVRSTGTVEYAVVLKGFTYESDSTVNFFGQILPIPAGRVIYVLKRSGGMDGSAGTFTDRFGNQVSGTRWDRAADATIASIQALPDWVRFNVITYACEWAKFSTTSVRAQPAIKAAAEVWILGHLPFGGSGMGMACAEALQERRNATLLLATDGQANCGATGTAGHLNMILNENTQSARIHTFGIGDFGVWQQLLDDIATQTGGTYTHIYP